MLQHHCVLLQVNRAHFIHEYRISAYSLFAAVSLGLDAQSIITALTRLSKVPVHEDVERFICSHTEQYGRVKLVLHENKHYLESEERELLNDLERDEVITHCLASGVGGITVDRSALKFGEDEPDGAQEAEDEMVSGPEAGANVFRVQLHGEKVTEVKNRCANLSLPVLEEYDFRNDKKNKSLNITLKPTVSVRNYQAKCLSKMFGGGRARSGIIVLPCGAGKTLVGISAATTVNKQTLVVTSSNVAVEQWKCEFLKFTTIKEDQIVCFQSTSTSERQQVTDRTQVIVSTYSMIGHRGKRREDALYVMENHIKARTWGLLLLDEVHVISADTFQTVIHQTKAHCKLGLTATLVREDEGIEELNFLIGPKLYEANWIDLTKEAWIANVMCCEVWCPMAKEFMHDYLDDNHSAARRRLSYQMNPNKFRTCEWLVREHEKRGDKIIIFSDSIFVLEHYAKILDRPSIQGSTPLQQRLRIFQEFNTPGGSMNTIIVSKIGDNAIDLPSANIIIQVSSHFAARRQEAQRLGRILRPKAKTTEKYNAYFYSLVSKDTREMYYSAKRQRFLVEQGYAFKVINTLVDEKEPNLRYGTEQERIELLAQVAATAPGTWDLEGENADAEGTIAGEGARGTSRRVGGSASALAGGAGGASYSEFDANNVFTHSVRLDAGQASKLKAAQKAKAAKPRKRIFEKRYEKTKKKK